MKKITEEFKKIYKDQMDFIEAKKFLREISRGGRCLESGEVLNPLYMPWVKSLLDYLNLMEKQPTKKEWEKYGHRLDDKSGGENPEKIREIFMETGVLLDSIFGKLGGHDDNYLDAEDFSNIFQYIEFLDYYEGEIVLEHGEAGNGIYIVRKGSFAVYRNNITKATNNPKDYLTKLYQGKLFGEMSTITGQERKNTIQALEDAKVLYINLKNLELLDKVDSKAFPEKSVYKVMKEEMKQIQEERNQLFSQEEEASPEPTT
ncbi:MAG: cyclic nucleotide-binding domain-containing protein [Nitrospinae bacterium]|nr:cyclic nucleotide-binding domain-containing protein [Nitrospinota bacterium]